jgi:hypothetical protein
MRFGTSDRQGTKATAETLMADPPTARDYVNVHRVTPYAHIATAGANWTWRRLSRRGSVMCR